MKNLIIIITILLSRLLVAQENTSLNKNMSKFNFGTYVSSGLVLSPYGSPNFALGFELKNKKLFGFGAELNANIYDSPDLNMNPPVSEIQNYDPEVEMFSGLDIIEGNTKDRMRVLSFYVSKGVKLNRFLALNAKIGPSINFTSKNKFTYIYSPAFGTFSGGSSSSFVASSSNSNNNEFGLNFKLTALIKIGIKTVLEFSPYYNVNKEQNIMGLQLGFVFGKKYKQKFFN
ncbi:MAG: hypothetical protein QNK20_17295 [Aureibaculum sp.]|nr:hypothetical protein [Aureibaculum sp.]